MQPVRTTRRKRQAPEKRTQRQVTNALQSLGYWVQDYSQPRASMMPVGHPDLLALHWRLPDVWVEVKDPKRCIGKRPEDVLSDNQRGWHKAARERGQKVITVDGVSGLLKELKALGVEIS